MKPQHFYLPEIIPNMHCHGRDMREKHKTTIYDILKLSAENSITITGFMPNTRPPNVTEEIDNIYAKIIQKATDCLNITTPQYRWFGATDYNLEVCDRQLEKSDIIGIKIYPIADPHGNITTTGTKGIGVAYDASILKIMESARDKNKTVCNHCADPYLFIIKGKDTIEGEVKNLKNFLSLAKKVPCVKIMIPHVSCRKSAELIIEAQQEGINVAMELCPHYLWFDNEMHNWHLNEANFYKCYNSLRNGENREFLISLLATDNDKIIIGSDHAPHTSSEKRDGAAGIPNLYEMVPVIITLAIQNKIPESRVAELLSFNASKFFNIPVPSELVKYKIEEKVNLFQYPGDVVNPWKGSQLYFPKRY